MSVAITVRNALKKFEDGSVVIPMVVMFVFFQKYYVQGIAATGIKG